MDGSSGAFYSGHYTDVEFGFALKLKGYATLALNANFVRGHLPQGKFTENVYQLKADFFLSPDLGLMNYIQYDDVSKKLGVNLRFRWQISPGQRGLSRLHQELGAALGPAEPVRAARRKRRF